jgi:hypothetical protein
VQWLRATRPAEIEPRKASCEGFARHTRADRTALFGLHPSL